ncbi:MAG: hypothetical protein IJ201_12505 [Solobacterium sp.]|nr:hypothetical protein [Solobacterium sp.]
MTHDHLEHIKHVKIRAVDLEAFERQFSRRYRIKKIVNAIISFVIVFCGVTAVLYSIFIFHNNLFNRMRFMTFDGTLFTTVISLLSGIVFLREAKDGSEVTNRNVYFLRLSAATTEFVIFTVVMVGLTPLVPDLPDVTSYTGIMMHLVIPTLMVTSFVINDAPLGKLKPLEPFYGTMYITLYALIMFVLFGLRILPSSLAPYSFLDFDNTGWGFKLICLTGIYVVGYFISLALASLNNQLSWIWFFDFRKLRNRQSRSKGRK